MSSPKPSINHCQLRDMLILSIFLFTILSPKALCWNLFPRHHFICKHCNMCFWKIQYSKTGNNNSIVVNWQSGSKYPSLPHKMFAVSMLKWGTVALLRHFLIYKLLLYICWEIGLLVMQHFPQPGFCQEWL